MLSTLTCRHSNLREIDLSTDAWKLTKRFSGALSKAHYAFSMEFIQETCAVSKCQTLSVQLIGHCEF